MPNSQLSIPPLMEGCCQTYRAALSDRLHSTVDVSPVQSEGCVHDSPWTAARHALGLPNRLTTHTYPFYNRAINQSINPLPAGLSAVTMQQANTVMCPTVESVRPSTTPSLANRSPRRPYYICIRTASPTLWSVFSSARFGIDACHSIRSQTRPSLLLSQSFPQDHHGLQYAPLFTLV